MVIHSRKRGRLLAGAAGLILLAGAVAWVRKPAPANWRTAVVDRGEVSQRIQATGTLNALIEVSVGTQVSGVVTALYADFNSLVKKGQLCTNLQPDYRPDSAGSCPKIQTSAFWRKLGASEYEVVVLKFHRTVIADRFNNVVTR